MRIIYCAGNQGRVVVDILRASDEDEDLAFVDDDESIHGERVDDVPVLGRLSVVDVSDVDWIVAYGGQGIRLQLAERVAVNGGAFFSAIHPSATVSATAEIGTGVMLNAESYVGPGATIGEHTLVDSCVNVSHDVTISKGATITPGATLAGSVAVETDAYIGPGATVLKSRTIAEGAVVGAGAVVTHDVPANTTVIGVPATDKDGDS